MDRPRGLCGGEGGIGMARFSGKKLAIIGASHFQNPLILKAKELGCETHVFAWKCGDVGERTADHFYPISITECDAIAEQCRRIGVDGVCTIGTDLGNITVSRVAAALGLVANPVDVVDRSTNKHLMREAFVAGGDPSPRSYLVGEGDDPTVLELTFPIIVKPVDRSGSRGITKLQDASGLARAVALAQSESFSNCAVVEEFMDGEEFSVEFCSWEGTHAFLALTKKFTTGAPGFVETGHLEPAPVSEATRAHIEQVVSHALDTLGVRYGASHSEVMLMPDGRVGIVEIGSRMGGDCIGSDLVFLSTGIDFTAAVISVALGEQPDLSVVGRPGCSAIRFVLSQADLDVLADLKATHPELLHFESPIEPFDHEVTDSSSRFGYFIMRGDAPSDLDPWLPRGE